MKDMAVLCKKLINNETKRIEKIVKNSKLITRTSDAEKGDGRLKAWYSYHLRT